MCNDYGLRAPISAIEAAFSQVGLTLEFAAAGGRPNLEPREDIMPSEIAPIVRLGDGGPELVQAKWGFAPARPKAPPVINFRSEGRSFANSGRCLIPATHFYEFTAPEPGGRVGKGGRPLKTKWEFTLAGEEVFCVAGLWRADPEPGATSRYTMLTVDPGPDVAPYHDRQIVVLPAGSWGDWLELSRQKASCCGASRRACSTLIGFADFGI